MKIYFLYLTVIIALLCGSTNAHAQSTSCSLGGAAVAFGVYDPTILTPNDTAGAVIYRCGQGDRNIMITLSVGGGTSYLTRRMTSGSEKLFYNI
jgi:hypothetical protein